LGHYRPGRLLDPPFAVGQLAGMSTTEAPLPPITAREWAWVRDLIGQVQRDTRREAFAYACGQWQLACRQFHRTYLARIAVDEPSDAEWAELDACQQALMARGRKLVALLETFLDDELARLGLTRGQILAEFNLLERDWDARHTHMPEAEFKAGWEKIFGAAP
jgi:hypothetical protein